MMALLLAGGDSPEPACEAAPASSKTAIACPSPHLLEHAKAMRPICNSQIALAITTLSDEAAEPACGAGHV